MTPDPASRRDNGLRATAWRALVDVDPRLSADLLTRLATAGVPAYVEPITVPALDRLWVDPDHAGTAREVVADLHADLGIELAITPVEAVAGEEPLTPTDLPAPAAGPAPLDEEALFQQIVQGYAATAEEPQVAWPDRPARSESPPRRRKTDLTKRALPDAEALPAWLEPEAIEPEEDDHFAPPPPPPLRWFHPRTLMATLGIVAGILAIFVPRALQLPDSNGSRVLGMVLLLSGAGALIWWMRESFGDPDDGAVV